ncbi:MAG: ice-binding family protein, partial [Betaproteobacteria bacterium]
MTNEGTSTVITGAQGQAVSIGTTGASTLITGFHDTSVAYVPPPAASGCTYTETTLNRGVVNGTINTDAPPPTLSCPAEGTAGTKAIADAAAAAALAAFNNLAGRTGATDPGANLGGLTLAPGLYKTAGGSFLITGSDL